MSKVNQAYDKFIKAIITNYYDDSMTKMRRYANLLLLLAAALWGFGFVAQRKGMESMGPFTFNAMRFALGGISLFPLIWYSNRKKKKNKPKPKKKRGWQKPRGGLVLGIALFSAASLQQTGIGLTTAGKAGFITGLYVVIAAFLGLLHKQKIKPTLWWGVFLVTVGLYFLCITGNFHISIGDVIVLVGAFYWAVHMKLKGYFSPQNNPDRLAQYQFFTCSILSFIAAFSFEKITVNGLINGLYPILYSGFISVGAVYTIHIAARKIAYSTHVAIILSLESVFAAFGGWLILNETLSPRMLIGCCFMLTGILAAQLDSFNLKKILFEKPKPHLNLSGEIDATGSTGFNWDTPSNELKNGAGFVPSSEKKYHRRI